MSTEASPDIGQLSTSQQDALQQYTSVTDQEVAAAIPLLQRSQWNVQLAVSRFFDGETEQPDLMVDAPPRLSERRENLQEGLLRQSSPASPNQEDSAPRIVPQPQNKVVRKPPLLLRILLMPFTFLCKLVASPFSLFAYLFPFLPRLLQPSVRESGAQRKSMAGRRMLSPQDTAARFRREFEEEYGSRALPFYSDGYAQALDLAKKELKFLLVLLVSPEHDDTSSFTKDTLLSPDFIQFVNNPENNLIFWAGNVQDSEAYQVSTALRCTKFPFTALITLTTEGGPASMSVVARLVGPMPPSTYVAKLHSTLITYQRQLDEARQVRTAQNFERTLRQDQDSAYERSLAQDRERVRQRRAQESALAEAEKAARSRAEAAAKHAADLEQWKAWRAQRVAPEPEANAKDVVRIALRMPTSAERVTRRFHEKATMEELYAFVECYNVLTGASMSSDVEEPVGFKHEYGFRLVSPMPRTVYGLDEGGSLLERIGRSGNLIVEPVSGEDEGEREKGAEE